MKLSKRKVLIYLARYLALVMVIVVFLGYSVLLFFYGYSTGSLENQTKIEYLYLPYEVQKVVERNVYQNTPSTQTQTSPFLDVNWGGPELWEAVNNRRMQLGVNSLDQKDELCTIASIRLNQQLELGKLDGHEGFTKLKEREDLLWIFEKYNLSEFLVSGVSTPDEAVSAWENTLAHKKLMTGGEYVWGCIYAQSGFGVAIAAY